MDASYLTDTHFATHPAGVTETLALDDLAQPWHLDGRTWFTRWRCPSNGPDHVVASPNGAWAATSLEGLYGLWPGWVPEEECELLDLEGAVRWLRGESLATPHSSLLDVWNWADDVARGLNRPVVPRNRRDDAVYDKLFFSTIPWLERRGDYVARWTPRQHTRLRTRTASTLGFLRLVVAGQAG